MLPSATDQRMTFPSPDPTSPSEDPAANVRPSGENATRWTSPRFMVSVRSSRPLATSQSLIVGSYLSPSGSPADDPDDARVRPSGENATLRTQDLCPLNVRKSLPLAISQSLIGLLSSLSPYPAARVRPSGEKAMERTLTKGSGVSSTNLPDPMRRIGPLGLGRVRSSRPLGTSQSSIFPHCAN